VSFIRVGLLTFLIGGLTAGLAGGLQLTGRPPYYSITADFEVILGFGWLGILTSLIGRNHPLGVIPAAFFVGGLRTGSKYMQVMAGVPMELVPVVQGIILIALSAPELLKMIKEKMR